jgi:hypothetical protein
MLTGYEEHQYDEFPEEEQEARQAVTSRRTRPHIWSGNDYVCPWRLLCAEQRIPGCCNPVRIYIRAFPLCSLGEAEALFGVTDIFAVQDDISKAIADRVDVLIVADPKITATVALTVHPKRRRSLEEEESGCCCDQLWSQSCGG